VPLNILQILLRNVFQENEWENFDEIKEMLCFRTMISTDSLGCIRADPNYKKNTARYDTVKINWSEGDGIWYAQVYGFIGVKKEFRDQVSKFEDIAICKSFDYHNQAHTHPNLKVIALRYMYDSLSSDKCKWDLVNISAIEKKVLIVKDFDNETRYFVLRISL